MSRIGKQLISIPENVKVNVIGQKIFVKGPKGSISRKLPFLIYCTFDETKKYLVLKKTKDTNLAQAVVGLYRTFIGNMVTGVSIGFEKKLLIVGVGYRAQLVEKDLVLNIGYSHPIKVKTPIGLLIKVESPNSIIISGVQKEVVTEFAAKIRSIRPPEPYKGKGIAYEGETILRKVGKTGK